MNDNDDQLSQSGPEPETDARDERVAAALAVEPLDELTRRRLVRNALDAAPRRQTKRAWWIGAAAAVVVAAVAVTAIALTSSGSGDQTTAARAPSTKAPAASAATSTAPSTGPAADQAGGANPNNQIFLPDAGRAPAQLGNLGDVTGADALRTRAGTAYVGLQSAFGSAPLASGTPTTTPSATRNEEKSLATNGAFPCAAALDRARPDFGTVVAVGSATVNGKPATVVVATGASGTTTAVAIIDAGCKVGGPVTLSR